MLQRNSQEPPKDGQPGADIWNPARPSARRSLILLAVGALVGLAFAGFGLFTAKGTAMHTVPPEDAALVNQQPILVSDLTNQLQSEFSVPYSRATPAQKRKVLNDMIAEELMVQRGIEMNLPASDPDVRAALVGGVELQNSATVIAEQPTPAQMSAYYQTHMERYRTQGVIALHDLLLPAPANAVPPAALSTMQHVADDLRQGQSIQAVEARYHVQNTGRVEDDELDFAAKIHLGDKLYSSVIDLKAGQVSDPIVDRDGVHVVQIVKRVPSVQLTLAQAQDQVFTDLKKDDQNAVQANNIRFLNGKAQILIAKGFSQ
jgi:hypothetical protein